MAGALGAVQVRNLAVVQRALALTEAGMRRELKGELKSIGEPIRRDAEAFALAAIPTIGPKWQRMRVGLTLKSVYVVPASKGRGGKSKRPNLGARLLEEALERALEVNQHRIADDVDAALGRIVQRFGSIR